MFSIQQFTELPDQHFFPGYDSELVHALLCSALLCYALLCFHCYFSAQARTLIFQMLLFYRAINISALEEREARCGLPGICNPFVFSSTSHGNDS